LSEETTVEVERKNGESVAEGAHVLLLATEKTVFGFDLLEVFRVAIGRHESNDLSFNSRNVSNYHAEILNEGDALVLHDLGSTNGSYVNEERVKRRKLRHGDRLRIGNNEITVRLTSGDSKESEPNLPQVAQKGSFRRAGSENEGPTPRELLLGLCKGPSVRLVLARNKNTKIEIYIHDGKVVFAESGKARAEKALYRAFEWIHGEFMTEPFPANDAVPRSMTVPVETLVEEGEQQAKELDDLINKLPPPDAPIRLVESCKMRICDFTPAEMEVFQSVIRHGNLGEAIDNCPMTDLRIMTQVHALIRKKVFALAESASLLEQTNIITRH
jgi:pSer/pThr/pTyr-binding forkhead associated (FHA) protein